MRLVAAGVFALHAWLLVAWPAPQPRPRLAPAPAVALRVVAVTPASRAAEGEAAVATSGPSAPLAGVAATEPPLPAPRSVPARGAADRTASRSAPTPPRARPGAAGPQRIAPPPAPEASVLLQVDGGPATPPRVSSRSGADPLPGPPIEAPIETPIEPPALPAEALPHYRTRVPPAAVLHYAVRRGVGVGTAVLAWERDADRYRLTLEADAGGRWVEDSGGAFDADGLAPLRHTDARVRRGTLATNFRRDEGAISFSASSRRHSLVAGTQDRLSWLIQVAAVLEAEPERRERGATIVLPVAGSRGELEVWALRNEGLEEVSAHSGARPALRLSREPIGTRDLGIDLWVDPERHHLPLRWVLRTPLGGTLLEFDLVEAILGP